jgi:metal-responsive CopG/Arc/MetJ family transcriptional regulator
MKTVTKVSVRIYNEQVDKVNSIQKELGRKSFSEFARQAIDEKLERFTIGKIVEDALEQQNKLNLSVAKLIKIAVERDETTVKNLAIIAESLSTFSNNKEH